jgi:hypothetical protein
MTFKRARRPPIPERVRARLALWIFRALFYPAAALVAVLLLFDHDKEPVPTGPVTLAGLTAQNNLVSASARDGRVFRFGLRVRASCPGDQHYDAVWWPVVGDGAPFAYDGEFVRVHTVRDVTTNWTVTEDLRIAARTEAHLVTGTISALITVREPFAGVCRANAIRFYAASHQ